MQLKFKKISPNAVVPSYAHADDACFDLSILIDNRNNWPYHCTEYGDKLDCVFEDDTQSVTIPSNYSYVFHTGLKCEIDEGYAMKIYVRSSTGIKKGLILSNGTGIIDSGYRGELLISLTNVSDKPVTVKNLERVAQAEIVKVIRPEVIWTLSDDEELSPSLRGEGGIGSTGGH